MQANGRFVQDVHHAYQAGADLAREADALRLAARQRIGTAIERQVVETDIDQELQAQLHFLDYLLGNLAALAGQTQTVEKRIGRTDSEACDLGQVVLVHEHIARGTIQARARTFGAGLGSLIAGQLLAHHIGIGFAIAPFHVGQYAFKGMLALVGATAGLEVGEFDFGVAAAVQNDLADLGRNIVERRVDIKAVVAREGRDQLKVIGIAPVPAADRAGRQTDLRALHDALLIEELHHAETVAGAAGTDRIVEREQSRLEFADAVATDPAGEFRREHDFGASARALAFHRHHACHAFAESECGLEGFGQTLFQIRAHAEAIDDDINIVLLAQRQDRWLIEHHHFAIHHRAQIA